MTSRRAVVGPSRLAATTTKKTRTVVTTAKKAAVAGTAATPAPKLAPARNAVGKSLTPTRLPSTVRAGAAKRVPSPDFTRVMGKLEKIRAKNEELDERINRLFASLA